MDQPERTHPSDLIDAYATTVVSVRLADEWVDGCEAARQLGSPVFVITAHNPGSEPFDAAENDRRNDLLREELCEVGQSVLPAAGRSRDGSWEEASFAVTGLDLQTTADFGRRHGQVAFFELRRDRVVVHASDLSWMRERSCSEAERDDR
jgi:hypothetical protein